MASGKTTHHPRIKMEEENDIVRQKYGLRMSVTTVRKRSNHKTDQYFGSIKWTTYRTRNWGEIRLRGNA
jgi:hypothetical protein